MCNTSTPACLPPVISSVTYVVVVVGITLVRRFVSIVLVISTIQTLLYNHSHSTNKRQENRYGRFSFGSNKFLLVCCCLFRFIVVFLVDNQQEQAEQLLFHLATSEFPTTRHCNFVSLICDVTCQYGFLAPFFGTLALFLLCLVLYSYLCTQVADVTFH